MEFRCDKSALSNAPIAEYCMTIANTKGMEPILDVLKMIKTRQQVVAVKLTLQCCISGNQENHQLGKVVQLVPELVKLSKSIREVKLYFITNRVEYCWTFVPIFQHIIDQLRECQELENLYLCLQKIQTSHSDMARGVCFEHKFNKYVSL